MKLAKPFGEWLLSHYKNDLLLSHWGDFFRCRFNQLGMELKKGQKKGRYERMQEDYFIRAFSREKIIGGGTSVACRHSYSPFQGWQMHCNVSIAYNERLK